MADGTGGPGSAGADARVGPVDTLEAAADQARVAASIPAMEMEKIKDGLRKKIMVLDPRFCS